MKKKNHLHHGFFLSYIYFGAILYHRAEKKKMQVSSVKRNFVFTTLHANCRLQCYYLSCEALSHLGHGW